MPEAPQWARVRGDVNCNVRRGAWYEVVRLSPEEVVLDPEVVPVGLGFGRLVRRVRCGWGAASCGRS